MIRVARLLEAMVEAGVIRSYALFGAVAQMRYTEAVVTMDADVLVELPEGSGLDLLRPIYAFCSERGFHAEGEAVRVGDWPVQFIPTFNRLTAEAVREAETGDLDGQPLRVVRAVHLAVIALSVGRAKDLARVIALREAGAVEDSEIGDVAGRHGLAERWSSFLERFNAR